MLAVAFAVLPVAFAVLPVAFAVRPVAFAVRPVAFAVRLVAFAVRLVAFAVLPVAFAVPPVAFAVLPVALAVRAMTGQTRRFSLAGQPRRGVMRVAGRPVMDVSGWCGMRRMVRMGGRRRRRRPGMRVHCPGGALPDADAHGRARGLAAPASPSDARGPVPEM